MSTTSGTRVRARGAPGTEAKPAPGNTVAGIAISRPAKLLYPGVPLSKLDLAHYYAAVGERIVPHLRGRPLSLVRCPDGWGAQCFHRKHADAAANAPVATPIDWGELDRDMRFDHFNARNIAARLRAAGNDPWKGFGEVRQAVTAAMLGRVGAGA